VVAAAGLVAAGLHIGVAGEDDGRVSQGADSESRIFRIGGASYLQIPAEQPRRAAAFYAAVFGWSLHGGPDNPSFEDGTGHVMGHFVSDRPTVGAAGIRPYVFVADVAEALDKVVANGGDVITAPYPEGDLRVATFRDPFGNVLGVWQQAPT
jgi:predicted enzyme related to lactoylglutathione lyase